MTDINLRETTVRSDAVDLASRKLARAQAAIPSLNADAKASLAKARAFLGKAVVAHMLGDLQETAECASAVETWGYSALVKCGYYEGYPEGWPFEIMGDQQAT